MALVHVEGLNKFYSARAGRLHVLRDLTLDVAEGEMVAVVGASGVGKSSLLHVLGGLDRADSGVVEVGESRPPSRWSSVDLPDPERPVMAMRSPVATSRSTPRSTGTGCGPW